MEHDNKHIAEKKCHKQQVDFTLPLSEDIFVNRKKQDDTFGIMSIIFWAKRSFGRSKEDM